MKKTLTNLLCFLLCFMCIALCACSGDNNTGESSVSVEDDKDGKKPSSSDDGSDSGNIFDNILNKDDESANDTLSAGDASETTSEEAAIPDVSRPAVEDDIPDTSVDISTPDIPDIPDIPNVSPNRTKGEKISYADLEKKDLNGREFYIIERWFGYGKGTIDFTGEVLYMEDYEGNLNNVNKAKKDIIEQVQKDYNCTITGEIFGAGSINVVNDLKNLISSDIMSGVNKYDFFFETYYYYTNFITRDYLLNVKELDTLNLKSTCWDQNAVSELSILNELYFLTGDINTYDNDGTVVMLFNKDFYEELGYNENLYDLVKDKEWTFDKLVELSKQFANIDYNGDRERNEFDNWFMGSEQANLYRHCVAAGESICTKDENDIPKLTMTTEGTINALTDAVNFYNSGSVLVATLDEYRTKYPGNGECFERTVTNAFLEGRELFYMTTLNQIPYFRHMEDEFGILPLPLYSKSQDEYSTSMSAYSSSVLMIPNTSKSDDDLGLVIQALAELSEEKLTPEYYEKQLKFRIFKDEESAEMLDIIFNNRHYDLGEVFSNSWNKPEELYIPLDTDILTRFQRQEKVINDLIDDTIEDIKDAIHEN